MNRRGLKCLSKKKRRLTMFIIHYNDVNSDLHNIWSPFTRWDPAIYHRMHTQKCNSSWHTGPYTRSFICQLNMINLISTAIMAIECSVTPFEAIFNKYLVSDMHSKWGTCRNIDVNLFHDMWQLLPAWSISINRRLEGQQNFMGHKSWHRATQVDNGK